MFRRYEDLPSAELLSPQTDHVAQGGWAEHILAHSSSPAVMDKYFQKCKDLGFDVIEISAGFLSFPPEDWLRLVDKVHSYGLKAKPELGIQFGAGGGMYMYALELFRLCRRLTCVRLRYFRR